MCSRFQIGSNSPLANRKARMFWAASLPRKWSIRKTCSSSKTSCTHVVEGLGAGQVGAERLLHDHPGPVGQPGLAQHLDHGAVGGRAGCSGSAAAGRSPPISFSALATASASAVRARSVVGTKLSRFRTRPTAAARSCPWRTRRRRAGPGGGTPRRSARWSSVADDAALGQHARLRQVEQAGQELARRQVARRAEQHDDVGLDLVTPPPPRSPSFVVLMPAGSSFSSETLPPMILATDSSGSFWSSVIQSVGSGRPSTCGQSEPKMTRSSPMSPTISSTSSSQNGLIHTWCRNVTTGSSVK